MHVLPEEVKFLRLNERASFDKLVEALTHYPGYMKKMRGINRYSLHSLPLFDENPPCARLLLNPDSGVSFRYRLQSLAGEVKESKGEVGSGADPHPP
mgnify:CR=1 FL=1